MVSVLESAPGRIRADGVRAEDVTFIGDCAGAPGAGIADQVEGAFREMERRLAFFGLSLSDVVQMDFLIRDARVLPAVEQALGERFRESRPAHRTVGGPAPDGGDGLLFRMDAVAYAPRSG